MISIYAGIFLLLCHGCNGNFNGNKETVLVDDNILTASITNQKDQRDIETIIKDIEKNYRLLGEKDPSEEHINKVSGKIINYVDELSNALKQDSNMDKFIEAKGFLKVFSTNLHNANTTLRTKLLLLLKDIFDAIPQTMHSIIPINIMDRLLDIFEYDDNLAVKAHALDVMSKWLPNNPVAQVRVIKIKGLDVFYNEINKLDIGVIENLMSLFINIIKEHMKAKKEISEGAPLGDRLLLYQRIGLIERLRLPNVCDGLFNIFHILWSHNSLDHGNATVFFELLKIVKPFCSTNFGRNSKATDFFQGLLKHEKFGEHNVDVGEFRSLINEYLDNIQKYANKDEF